MLIRIGYELLYDCPQPTPMLVMLNVHFSRVSDMVVADHLVTSPSVAIRAYRDGFGNWCNRIVAPAGRTRLSANGIVKDTGEPDVVASRAQQHAVEDLPDEALVFLLGSRYCETDRLSEIAWSLFGKTPLGWSRVQAICDYVHQHIAFGYEHARATRTAWEAYCDRTGVCRGGAWHTLDARNNTPRIGRVLIARGRDAADVAITTTFGPNTLSSFTVVTEEVAAAG